MVSAMCRVLRSAVIEGECRPFSGGMTPPAREAQSRTVDRKSTRLNSSHVEISYAVFCLKKKKKNDSGKTDLFGNSMGLQYVYNSNSLPYYSYTSVKRVTPGARRAGDDRLSKQYNTGSTL